MGTIIRSTQLKAEPVSAKFTYKDLVEIVEQAKRSGVPDDAKVSLFAGGSVTNMKPFIKILWGDKDLPWSESTIFNIKIGDEWMV